MGHHIAISIAGQSSERERLTNTHPLVGNSPSTPVRSLYVHIPFCFHKCHYCDFYSIVDSRDRQCVFAQRLIGELTALARFAGPLDTVFVGGGTPTLLRSDLWQKLLQEMARLFDLSRILSGEGEFTVECNPETATPELFGVLRDGGVNRLSLGAQSFHPTHLKTLERWHKPENVARAIEFARAGGIERQSLDLIFAIPGQSLKDLDADLSTALDLGVTHLSCYNLTYESNTPMTRRLSRGEFEAAGEDLEVDMQQLVIDRCAAAGLDRYEISNFTAPGHECAHNMVYWRQGPWLAAGPSASGHVAGWRWKNTPRLGDYLDSEGLAPVVDVEPLDPARALCERLMTGLRLREGIAWEEIERAGSVLCLDTQASLVQMRDSLVQRDLLQVADGRMIATESGFRFADFIAREFLGVLQ